MRSLYRKKLKRMETTWAFYDWANSVFPLVITAAIFPAYYENTTQEAFHGNLISIWGVEMQNTVLYSWAFSLSYLIIALLSPFLSGIADYSGKRKTFMKFFVILGSCSSSLLFFFTGPNILWGLGCLVLANIGFNGSLVFYNSYLPQITTPVRYDQVSAKGYAYGYVGSLLLLLFCFALISYSESIGIEDKLVPYRISFLLVGLWWTGFSMITFSNLPAENTVNMNSSGLITKGFSEIASVWHQVQSAVMLKRYLLAYFIYSAGVQTIIYMSAIFGAKELNLEKEQLIVSILSIQVVGIAGAYLFSFLSKKFSSLVSIQISLVIWLLVCLIAFKTTTFKGFFVLAALVGLVMGGIQSQSRSAFSKLIPLKTKDLSSYFSFSEFTEKIAIVGGTLSYGLIEQLSGSMRNSVIMLGLFFLGGFILLIFVRLPRTT